MPFGFDKVQVEQDLKTHVEVNKIYLEVKMLQVSKATALKPSLLGGIITVRPADVNTICIMI